MARAAPVARASSWSVPDRLLPHVLLWPGMIALALVFAYPLGYSFWISLNAYNITRPPVFVGLNNYVLIAQDGRVWQSFLVSFQFAGISLLVQFVIGFGLALLLHRVVLFRGLIRTIIIIPLMRGSFATALILLAVSVARLYDLSVAMTNGGPGIASEVPAKFVMDHLFDRGNVGLATAAATTMLITVVAVLAPLLYWQYHRPARPA